MAKRDQRERFHKGELTDGWRWFGAHPEEKQGKSGWTFRVWAPMPRQSPWWETSMTGMRTPILSSAG